MIDKKQKIQENAEEKPEDEAVKSFRKKIAENTGEASPLVKKEQMYSSFLNYAATACLAVTVLASGYKFYRNYRQMRLPDEPAEQVSSQAILSPTEFPLPSEQPLQSIYTEESKKKSKTDSGNVTPVLENPDQIQEENIDQKHENLEEEESSIAKEKASDESVSEGNAAERDLAEEPDEDNLSGEENGTAVKTIEETMEETASSVHKTYVIKPGDTLFQICLEHYGSMERLGKLCEINGISENDVIYPGEIIELP